MFWKRKDHGYELARQVEDEGDEEKSCEDGAGSTSAVDQKHLVIVFLCNLCLLMASIVFFVAGLTLQATSRFEKNILLKKMTKYSPLLDHINIRMFDSRVNGTLLNVHNSIYRQPPSPEVDAAWERLANLTPTVLTSEEVTRLGKDPSTAARYPLGWGLGGDAFVGELDAMHHFHCLDMLRRDIEFDHYYGDKYPDGKKSERHREHTSHCLHIILQQLMCQPSLDYIVLDWVEGQKGPFPDFSIDRRCVDYEAILRYQGARGVSGVAVAQMRAPEGQQRLPMSDEFLDLFEVDEDSATRLPHHADHSNDLD